MTRTRYRIFSGDKSPYFVTSTTVNWLSLFSNPCVAQIVFETLAYLQSYNRLIIYAYVLMENHLHMVASADDLAKELANFKSYSARRSIDYYKISGNDFVLRQLADLKQPHRVDRVYQFWQEGVHPKRIQDERMMRQKIEYIHLNPLRRGCVDEPEHWRYSSARNYAGLQGALEVCMDW